VSLHTGITSKIFSAKFFVRINKLTYAIYLLNPLVIAVVFGKIENGTFVDPVLHTILIIGITLLTYVLAIGFSLLFEIPFCRLSNEILRGSSQTAAAVTTQQPTAKEKVK
jgi:peptidoglycan/LPS O-acetylase OafA/YrhL